MHNWLCWLGIGRNWLGPRICIGNLLLTLQTLRSFGRSRSGKPNNGRQNNEPHNRDGGHSRDDNNKAAIHAL
ncbi:MAG: hypothetical protein ACYSWQ_29035 [Planctomycetota bacterium]